ncbi:beta strand repeat-containing protein [Aliikangiella marina]|uniref:beta strand repeat-containing protein n=1 Tax=Aliikangiella marina TaxID=1712262 RepID=UPI001AED7F16|nr:hypothetical protein [Aliikangiella marina]
MENLVGNDASDDFTVADGARISGLINGGNGSNSLTSNNSLANSWILTALYAGTLNGDAFSNIQSLVGNSGVSDTLTGINQANDWQITGTNAGTVGEDGVGTSIAFSGMENLVGNEGNDRFTLNAQIDSLNAGNGDNTITVNNAGTVVGAITAGTGIDTVTFNGAGTAGSLSTGAGDDVITIVDNSSVSGLIDGGADNDSVTITGSDVTITLGTDVANTETLTAGGGTNTLVGADNGGNTWLVDATNSVNDGTTTTVFSNFSILTAGNGGDDFTVNVAGIDTINGDTGNDVFTLDTAGLVNTINGGNGDDRLSIVNGNSIWTVDLADDGSVAVDGSPLVVTNFTSIETREGSLAGTDSIDLTSFGNAIIQLANYLNFDLIIGNVLGTLQGLDGQQNDWDITGANVGTVTVGATTYGFSGFGNLLGGSAIDNFVLQNGGSISGLIDGGLGNNSLTSNNSLANSWVLTALYAGTLNGDAFSNIQSIVGNSGVSDTLTGINQANDWQITGVDSGTVGEDGVGTSIAFSGMENLTGNDGSDDFTVADGARISGLINGGNGSNSLTSNNSLANSWILTALYAGTLNGDAFSNIQSLVGNSGVSDTLSGINQANDWQITGVDSGTVGEDGVGTSIAFSGMENLVGNDASDDFTVADGARISGLINGGNGSNSLTSNNSLANSWILTALYAGTLNGDAFSNIQSLVGNSGVSDTLTGINQANDWQITGTNTGTVGEDGVGTSIAFSGMENLVGNANDDNFQFVPGGSISGSIDGGAHINADTLDYSLLASVDIDLNTDLANVSNIEQIQGNNTASSLTGRNVSNTWLISGANIVDIDGITFSGFNNLVGGSVADLFVVAEGGSISGLIDGGLGTNTLQRTNTSGSNLWEITGQHQGTLNGNAFSNIQSLIGSADAVDTLTGRNQDNNWDISGTNSGSVSETGSSPTDLISFSEMENLNGGNADDRFRFATSGSVTGLIDGGDHVNGDIVDYSLQTDVNITLANAFNGVQNAEIIQGNNVNSTLTGDDAANTWLITGENEGSVASITFIGFNNLIGGNGNDLFNLAQGGSITGLINGGGGSNTLQRSNTSGDNTWVITGQHAGTINGNSFSNMQTLTGSASVTDTLIGRDQDNDWDITGNDSGTVAEAVVGPSDLISFSEMENLTGGSGDDRFRFATAGAISGIVDAGGHVSGDIVDYSLQAVVDITVSNAFNGVLNAEFVQGNNTNSTLTANNVDNTWLITGVNDGSVAGINFIDFNNLVGGSADDLFNLAEGGAITGIINGSGGANTLQRSNTTGDNVWVITGQYSGTLNGGSFLNIQTLTGSANANDTLTGRDQDNNWDISNTNSGTVAAAVVTPTDLITFSEMENLNGGSGDDRFRFAPNGLITGLIDAGAHVNGDIVDYSLQAQVNVNIANALNGVQNAEIVQGNNFDSTLTASDVSNTWIITGENDGSVAGITFIDFNILIGGSADDLFNLTEGGFITGLINGGAGTNTLQRTNTTGNNEWILTSQHSGTINGDAFSNIQNIIGSSSVVDTLTARNQNNNWMISGTDSGSVSDSSDTPLDTITFSDIENLNGGTGDDRFIFTDAGSISGAIDAGAHTTGDVVDYSLRTSVDVDLTNGINGIQNAEIVVGNNLASTLTAADVDNTWLITGENDGSVGGISFVDFNILNGGSANDLFNLAQGGSVTGAINGGAGANTLQRSNTSGTNEWIITGQYQGTLNGGDFVNIQTLVGSANAIDTLSGRDQNNNWDLNGVNSGTVAEAVSSPSDLITFSEMENLIGGSGDDRFRFAAGGSVTGSIDAGDHINGDIVDYSLQTVVNVSLDDAFNSVQNAEIIQGNNTDSTLNGADITNSWLITGENTGTIAGITFIGFNNLLGGSADDLFNLAEGGFVTGTIDGGAGNNTLQRSNTSGSNLWVISATHSGTINGNAFANIQNLVGSDTAVDTLVGRDQNNNWLITGTDLGSVSEAIDSPTDLINFSSMENLTGGNGDDRFSFMTGALISGIIDAGDHINGDIVDYSLQDTVSLTLADAFNGVQNAEIVQGNNVDSTLIGDNIANSWLITGENDGTVNGIVFIDFNNITGGTNVDVFTIQDGGTITGIINGGSGAGVIDILDLTALTTGVTVGVDESINADFTILGIEQLDANANDTVVNTIIASNTSNIWNIDGTNAGTLNLPTQSISFSGFANLTGGTSADIFNLNNADHITGLIDGGGGVGDELNMLGLGRDIIVQLGAVAGVSSSDTLYVNNIETILANSSRNNTINGLDVASRWAIDTTGLSTVESALTPSPDSTVAFSGFSVISGGIADDTFEIIDATGIVQINGGEGSGIDSIDYSNTMADVNVVIGDSIVPDTVNITGIEGLIGNGDGTSGFNSTISVIDGDNVWTISDFDGAGMADGINDGQFQDADGNIISFIDFNIIQGGSGNDFFDIQNGGSVTGYIHGGAGNDELRLSFNTSGQVSFIGGEGDDSVLLSGGGDDFDATYTSNVNGAEVLNYQNTSGVTYAFSFDEVESVVDNVEAVNFTIFGSTGADLIDISTGNVTVNGGTTVQFNNRTNLILSGESNDTFDLVGDLDLGNGNLTLLNSLLTNSSGSLLSADALVLDSVAGAGTQGSRINTDINTLSITNAVGDVYLAEADSIVLDSIDTSGVFDLVANGAVSQLAGTVLTSSNNFAVSTTGSIDLDNSNQLSGAVSLSTDGDITFRNAVATDFAAINARNFNLNVVGDITDSGTIIVTETLTIEANGNDIILDNATNNFNIINVTSANNATFSDIESLVLNDINVDNLLQVNAENLSTAADISVGAITINATGDVQINNNLQSLLGNIVINAGDFVQNANIESVADITLVSEQSITMASSTSSTANAGNISYTANGNVDLALLTTSGGTVNVTSSTGEIVDNNDDVDNIVANRAELIAQNGIGADNALETQLANLFAENGQGQIRIDNRGNIILERLATSGDITFNNADFEGSDISFMPGSVDAGYDVGSLVMTTEGGSFLGIGETPDFENADIVARDAAFLDSTLSGTFGSITRPLVLRIRDSVLITVRTSLNPQFAQPLPEIDDSGSLFRFSSFDAVSAIAGGQLVEVEELVEVDPAIFTDLTNYYSDEVAVRLPRDQLYEEDDEEEDEYPLIEADAAAGM